MNDTAPNRHLGIRIAAGLAVLLLIALFVMLARVATKQYATTQALETYESLQEAAKPAAARD